MRLSKLELHNFRKFEDLSINFEDDVTVLVGGNGFGKSAVLDASAVALGTYLIHIPGATRRNISPSDARVVSRSVGSTVESRPQFPIGISAEGELFGRKINWLRERKGPRGNTTVSGAHEMLNLSSMVREYLQNGKADDSWGSDIAASISTLPLVAYYGTGRLWAQAKHKKTRKSLRENAYSAALSPRADNDALMQWLRKMTLQQLQKGKAVPELVGVQRAIEECLRRSTGAENTAVYYDVQTDSIMADIYTKGSFSSLGLNQLSDGYRTTLSMVGDIAYRMAELNPQLGECAIALTPGVILIDEVDLHLHPRWQAQILGDLRAVFPKVQFIVSTHSPSVISSVRREKLRIFDANGSIIIPGSQTYGRDVSSIYREVLGASDRPEEIRMTFDKAYDALDNEDYSKLHSLLDELKGEIGSGDPELTSLETSLWLAEDE